ncbi:amidohydrolase [Chloroflexota bacterium]
MQQRAGSANLKPFADLALIGGKIVTVDKDFSVKQAVAVKGDTIVAVRNNEHIRALIEKDTQVIDLKGKTVLPGIHDPHTHAAWFGGTLSDSILNLQHPNVNSISDVVQLVKNKTKELEPGQWVIGYGWGSMHLEEISRDPGRQPNKWDLDPVSPSNPVFLCDFSGHIGWCNSKAFEAANITETTPAPAGGEIRKDKTTRECTGLLVEMSAIGLLMQAVPKLTREQKRSAIAAALDVFASLGITTVTDSALGPAGDRLWGGLVGTECISIYNDLYNQGKLKARVNVMPWFGRYGTMSLDFMQQGIADMGVHTGFGNARLRIAAAKIFADGVPGPTSKSAWMSNAYADGTYGRLMMPGNSEEDRYNELMAMISYAHKHGFQLGIHSCGDRTNKACVDGFSAALSSEPRDARHYLIHGSTVSDDTIEKMLAGNIGICTQPSILKFQAQNSSASSALKKLVDAGVHISSSSDAPITYPGWISGIAILVDGAGLSIKEAIQTYTVNAAWQNHMEDIVGSIEEGKLADFCILDRDILSINVKEIENTTNVMTIIDGNIVYRDKSIEVL